VLDWLLFSADWSSVSPATAERGNKFLEYWPPPKKTFKISPFVISLLYWDIYRTEACWCVYFSYLSYIIVSNDFLWLIWWPGRAIAQDSRRLPNAAARVRAQVRSCGICGGQSGGGAGFLRVLRFPLRILIPPTAPHSSGSGTIGQLVADVPSGLSLTPPQETKETKLHDDLFVTSVIFLVFFR
jgi:hypothetical protein